MTRQFLLLRLFPAFLVCILLLITPNPACAYIGPGAGFAVVGSSAVFLGAIALGILGLLLLPFRLIRRSIRSHTVLKKASLKRLIILGFDGMDPRITETMLEQGELPSLKGLKEKGSYSRLKSTIPSLSPVAWSTFQTGVNPGSHNIFDFLTRDKRTYLPGMVSVETTTKVRKSFFRQTEQATVTLTRKSQPFWKVLGKYGIFSTILRVPISYPPEPLNGSILSAMCTPDIRGSQGTFMHFSSDQNANTSKKATNGEFHVLEKSENLWRGTIKGPTLHRQDSSICFSIRELANEEAELVVHGQTIILKKGTFSEWFPLTFKVGKHSVSGISRFLLQEITPTLSLYVSPVNADPEASALPISSPRLFSRWLSQTIGRFGTLGFLEDTWGRNEQALNDTDFLNQLMLNQQEREKMLFEVLTRMRRGLCVCVFDGTDRAQHIFWRYRDENHPAPKENKPEFKHAIEDIYKKMDNVVSRVLKDLKKGDDLIVLSDHGFGSFRRCINLNTWLLQEGYLALKPGCDGTADYLTDVDWSKTRAFGLGITGIYLNRIGREQSGIVTEHDAESLAREIAEKLSRIRDPKDDSIAIKQVFLSKDVYKGLYADEAPDLIMGYTNGYRVSWDSVTGALETQVFSDNLKAWSGDHHIHPDDVPGVIFSTLKLSENPALIDLAPTVLKLFGISAPRYMEGKALV